MGIVTPLSPQDLVERVDDLPPMPASISEVITACDDPDMTVGQLTQVVLKDQNLTASILKLANSSFYGHTRRVATITEAVVLLGFSAIKSLAISSHTARLLKVPLPGYGMDEGELWKHSLGVAFTARRLAIEVQLAPVEEAYVAGLLHDIGKLVLSQQLEGAYEDVSARANELKRPFHAVEAEMVGFDHAEVGARVAAAWSFPAELEEAVRCHHNPTAAQLKPQLSHVVHMADAACMMLGIGLGADGLAYHVAPETLDMFSFDQDRLVALLDEMEPLISADSHEQL